MTTETTTTKNGKTLDVSRAPLVPQLHPWLLIHQGLEKEQQIFYSVSTKSCYKSEIPELRNKFIFTSSNGWLVMKDLGSEECFLFNLFTKGSVQLPALSSSYVQCVLSSPPSDPNCRILFIDETMSSITICRVGEDQIFHEHDMGAVNLSCAAYFEGKFYLMDRGHLVLLDFTGPTLCMVKIISEKVYDEFVDPVIIDPGDYLVESGGELLYVRKLHYGLLCKELLGFAIYRADIHQKKWVKLKNIGQRAIFLDAVQGVSVSVRPQEGGDSLGIFKSNCVYFTEPRGRCLYVYDLEEETNMAVLPSSEVDKSNNCVHCWVMMSS